MRLHYLWLGAAVVAVACSVPAEQPIVSDFFAASRLRDLTALSRFSTVVFEPRRDGMVSTFRIQRVSPEQVQGNTRRKEVEVAAPVRLPDGQTRRKTVIITLQRRAEPRPDESGALYGGWLVTGFRDGTAPRPTPQS